MVEAVAQQICLVVKSEDHRHLAGYSYGGFLAWEVASNLITRGIALVAIGLIDRDARGCCRISTADKEIRSFSPANIVDQTGKI